MKATRRVLVLLLALGLVAAGCSSDDDGSDGGGSTEDGMSEGGEATGDPIAIGAIFDLTGPTSDVGALFADGIKARVEYVNANGGLDGHPIDLKNADYAYDVAQAEQLYSQYKSEGIVAFSGWGTGDTEALRPQITEDELPFISASYSAGLANPAETPYNFVVALTYSDQMRIALNHIASTNDGEHVEVAVFHHDSPFGLSPVEDGRSYIADMGYDIGYEAYAMPGGAADYFGELTQAAGQGDGGADYIIVQNVPSPAAQLVGNVADQGMDATVFCLNWCSSEGLVELAGDASEGSLGILPFAPASQADGDLSEVEAYLTDNGQTLADATIPFVQGWFQLDVMLEGIRTVLANGDEVTGPNIKAAMESMDPFDTPVSAAIDFTAEDHAGMHAGRVYEVQGGVWTTISDEITP